MQVRFLLLAFYCDGRQPIPIQNNMPRSDPFASLRGIVFAVIRDQEALKAATAL